MDIKEAKERAEVVLEICRLISSDDSNVISEVESCLSDTEMYFETHLEDYEARGMTLEDYSLEEIQWIGMFDCLINNGYAVEFDWKASLADFGWGIKELKTFKQYGLSLEDKFLEDDYIYNFNGDDADDFDYEEEETFFEADISVWSQYLNNKWLDRNICLGNIDTGSDSYKIFIAPIDTVEKLSDLAECIDEYITRNIS